MFGARFHYYKIRPLQVSLGAQDNRGTTRALTFTTLVAIVLMRTSSVHSDSATMLECPNRPSCVSSRAQRASQHVEPLRYRGELEAALDRLARIIDAMPRSAVHSRTETSLSARFHSRLFGFVDEVDFMASHDGTIDLRSLSQSGYYDFGVNRRRIETIRTLFEL